MTTKPLDLETVGHISINIVDKDQEEHDTKRLPIVNQPLQHLRISGSQI